MSDSGCGASVPAAIPVVRQARRVRVGLLLAALLLSINVTAATMVIGDIRVLGLQRVSAGTVFNLLPIGVGDTIDETALRQVVRVLFRSGYFDDIQVLRDGNVLIIEVLERPAIDKIEIDGNKAIPDESLRDGLKQQGLEEGEIFKRAILERVRSELERQYVAQGRYGASLETNVEELPRNRVSIDIQIDEGDPAGIRHINIVGNTSYSDRELLEAFELKLPTWFSFYTNSDKYSREKLGGDIEKLEAWYQDRGYVNFRVDSTQVALTPDREQVYLTINVAEGERYTVGEVNLVGELNDIPADAIRALISVEEGQIFSRANVTATEERIVAALGNSGYTFANASGVPYTREDGIVDVRFIVDTGKRAYVRRIAFQGNTVTHDNVLRRELRQLEGGWASTALIDLSKVRLERLGFFKEVNVETPAVPGTDDQIDVEIAVEEQPSGSISATIGFAQGSGLILGAQYEESNVFGTGNSLSLGVSWSQFQRAVSMNYFDPYFTADGISRGYSLFFRKTDFDQGNIARFSTDAFGGGVTFGFPIGETQRINFGTSVDYTLIKEGNFPALEILEFIQEEGDKALNLKLEASWRSSTLNRGLFPTAGTSSDFSVEVAVPGSDLTFYKLRYEGQTYLPVWGPFTLRLRSEVGYGDAYGGNESLPFYEHFFGGGFGSVRGFEINSLGPRSTEGPANLFFDPDGDPFGGNLLVEAGAEIIFPIPFVKDQRSFRSVLFVDAGNVFNTNCPAVSRICDDFDIGELRYSAGVAVTWITGLGPISFAIAKPFNTGPADEDQVFQFELGRTF